MEKVDIVLKYVNMGDPIWYKQYKKFLVSDGNGQSKKSLDNERVRDNFSLRPTLRSIEKYMSWVNNVFLVVQMESQVPKYIDRDKVKVILHEDFIPQEFLPTFNSHTIEMFLHLIPGLSSKYIVMDDDMIFLREISYDDLFDGDTPRDMFYEMDSDSLGYYYSNEVRTYDNGVRYHPMINNSKLACTYNSMDYDESSYWCPDHGISVFNKDYVDRIYRDYKEYIHSTCTRFRSDENVFYWAYRLCSFLEHKKVSKITCKQLNLSDITTVYSTLTQKLNHVACINDDHLDYPHKVSYINSILFKEFSESSIYERCQNLLICVVINYDKDIFSKWIKPFIDHYYSLGVSKIVIYDNSKKDQVLKFKTGNKLKKYDLVEYHYVGNFKMRPKQISYTHCYNTYKDRFDWILYIDIDELLQLGKYKSTTDMVSNPIYDHYDIIHLCRENNIIDNGIIYTGLDERIKSMVRTSFIPNFVNKNNNIKSHPDKEYLYSPSQSSIKYCCNTLGEIIPNISYADKDIRDNVPYLKRIFSRSNEDFLWRLNNGNLEENIFNRHSANWIEENLKIYDNIVGSNNIRDFLVSHGSEKLIDILNKDNHQCDSIDYVFPYVDCVDPEWFKTFNSYNGIMGTDSLNGEVRYDPHNLLKYKFRAISKYMPWIRNIYMIVSSPSQVPEWLDTSKVKIVYHKDFIPEEFLPTFNSTTIEMFLGNISELGEKFIYSNDDVFPSGKMIESDFFILDKPVLYIDEHNPRPRKSDDFLKDLLDFSSQVHTNCLNLASKASGKPYDKYGKNYHPGHFDKPMFKSVCKKLLVEQRDTIYNGITPIRSNSNHNQYIYTLYNVFTNNYISGKFPGKYFEIKNTKNNILNFLTHIYDTSYKNICIDFAGDDIPDHIFKLVEELFILKYPDKCKYER